MCDCMLFIERTTIDDSMLSVEHIAMCDCMLFIERAKRLDSSALGKEETKCSISSETIRAESFTHEKSRERTRDGLEESVETVDHSSNRLADRDVPFDFYTPPRVSPKGALLVLAFCRYEHSFSCVGKFSAFI